MEGVVRVIARDVLGPLRSCPDYHSSAFGSSYARSQRTATSAGDLPRVHAGSNDTSQDCRGQDGGESGLAGCSIDVEDRGTRRLRGPWGAAPLGGLASAGVPE
jgi:hypothetical protein